MRDALVAVDAGLLAARELLRMRLCTPLRLTGEIHRLEFVAVAALERIVRFQPLPLAAGELLPFCEELLARVDRAEEPAPHLLRRLHLARHLVGPVVRHVAVGADRAYAGADRKST